MNRVVYIPWVWWERRRANVEPRRGRLRYTGETRDWAVEVRTPSREIQPLPRQPAPLRRHLLHAGSAWPTDQTHADPDEPPSNPACRRRGRAPRNPGRLVSMTGRRRRMMQCFLFVFFGWRKLLSGWRAACFAAHGWMVSVRRVVSLEFHDARRLIR